MPGGGLSEAILEGDQPLETDETLPEVDLLTPRGFVGLIDRVVAYTCLIALLPMIVAAREQWELINRVWLMSVGGAIVASAVLMPYYAWSRRGIRPLALIYALAVLVGLIAWPLASPKMETAAGRPLLALLLGLGTVCMGLATSTRVAYGYGAVAAVVYFLVQLSPSGGSSSPLEAMGDALVGVVQPLAALFLIQQVRRSVSNLDASLVRRHALASDAAVNQALIDERRLLDAIVHDEVLTTFVAGGQSPRPDDPHVMKQAQQAIESLRQEAAEDQERDAQVSADQFVRLVKDVTASVCPRAEVLAEIPSVPVTLPQGAVRAMLQATREAALNVERHAAARHVQVLTSVGIAGRRVQARVTIADDGRGFDPEKVASARLGIRLALQGRMQSAGGRAEVSSSSGRGTTVRLSWAGDRTRSHGTPPRTRENVGAHPLFIDVEGRPFGIMLVVLTFLYVILAAMSALAVPRPGLAVAAIVLIATGMGVGVPGMLSPPIGWVRGMVVVVCAMGATTTAMFSLPASDWPRQAGWFVAPVMLLLVVTYAAGQWRAAWIGGILHALIVLGLTLGSPESPSKIVMWAFVPLTWLVVEFMVFFWFDSLWVEIDEADRSVAESARVNATLFSKLVLREVWLAELRSEVSPLLTELAEGRYPNSDEERKRLLLLEGSLRDGIRAASFNSPTLSAAIMDARHRGVDVNLVDNRGSRLPEPARRAALRCLEDLCRDSEGGRIVARTAPEGYGEAVTIVRVMESGATELIRISETGDVQSAAPTALAD